MQKAPNGTPQAQNGLSWLASLMAHLDGEISREQLATMLYRYAESVGMDMSESADLSSYADSSDVSDYASEALSWAVANGLINGMGDNTLNASGLATRAQVATILERFCNL